MLGRVLCRLVLMSVFSAPAFALEKPEITYKIFQFPANMIPRIDADASDWAIVPDDYVVGTDQLVATSGAGPGGKPDPSSFK